MPDGAVREDRNVGGAAADVEQAHAKVFFILGQHGPRRGERLQDQVLHLDAAAAHALDDVLRCGHGTRDDVHLDLEPHARHADRLAHILLAIDDEFLAQHVQDLLVGRDVHGARRLERAVDVERADFAVLHRHHAGGVEAADVAAGDADIGRGDLAIGHQLGFFQRPLDRRHGGLDVDDHTLLQPLGLVRAHAEDLERAVRPELRDQARHLRSADVERNDQVFIFFWHVGFTPRLSRAAQNRSDSAGPPPAARPPRPYLHKPRRNAPASAPRGRHRVRA